MFKERARWQLALSDVLKSLLSKEMLVMDKLEESTSAPLPEGFVLLQNGSPEIRLVKALPNEAGAGKSIDELKQLLGADTLKNGQSNAFRNKWAKKLPDGTFGRTDATLGKSDAELTDDIQQQLAEILATGSLAAPDADKKLAELRKRKLVATRKLVYFSIAKGAQFSLTVQKLETDLTFEMLQSGSWKTAPFKKYNFDAEGAVPAAVRCIRCSRCARSSATSSSRWASPRWPPIALSSPPSGASTRSLCRSSIRRATCRIPSSSRTRRTQSTSPRTTSSASPRCIRRAALARSDTAIPLTVG